MNSFSPTLISFEATKKSLASVSEVAVFVDEKAFKFNRSQEPSQMIYQIRDILGKIGTPYDCYLASDFARVKHKYKAIIVLDTYRTDLVSHIIHESEASGIGCYVIGLDNRDVTTDVLRDFCKNCGVHLYSQKDAVIYANQTYLFVHTCTEGPLEIALPDSRKLVPIMGAESAFDQFPAKHGCLFELK